MLGTNKTFLLVRLVIFQRETHEISTKQRETHFSQPFAFGRVFCVKKSIP
ncbi:MAG: hypothetical protein LBJ67_03205 [Planctomycetaceae bacterium]|jgi:hypothetical protein|nr:hypothetical protein [Planctomycetaceae bacterium]